MQYLCEGGHSSLRGAPVGLPVAMSLLPLAAPWAAVTHLPALASQSLRGRHALPGALLLSLVLASHSILLPRLFSNAKNNEEKDTTT